MRRSTGEDEISFISYKEEIEEIKELLSRVKNMTREENKEVLRRIYNCLHEEEIEEISKVLRRFLANLRFDYPGQEGNLSNW